MVTLGTGRDDPRGWVKAAYLILDAMESGDKLPSRSEIAGKLGIHEMTVRRAYREMAGNGFIRMVPGHGYYPNAGANPAATVGSSWFEAKGRPYVVRIELPLSAEEVVAALYRDHDRLGPPDLGTDEEVWGAIALAVIQDGLHAVDNAADSILVQEHHGTLAAPDWLALCRRRVAEVTGQD